MQNHFFSTITPYYYEHIKKLQSYLMLLAYIDSLPNFQLKRQVKILIFVFFL